MDIEHHYMLYALTIVLFLLMSAFFSAAETALTAITRARIFQLVMDGNRRAEITSKLRRKKESLISTLLVGNNAINIAASAIATSLFIQLFGNDEGVFIATVIMTFLIIVFAEILPKTYALHNTERVALALAPAINIIIYLLYPITHGLGVFIRTILKPFGIDLSHTSTPVSASDSVRGTIELYHREGKMIKQERDMLGSILDLNEIEVKDVMVHRTNVETIDADLPTQELVRKAVSTMHSRLPLWKGEPDNILGVLHVKNLIAELNKRGGKIDTGGIMAICHKPWFVPETTSLRDQLLAFRSKRQHLAFVVDEYGTWQGVITLEDIMEEIVGNIDDEHDESHSDIHKIGTDAYIISGSATVRDVNRHLDWKLPDDEASTMAGLLINVAENIPAIGAQYDVHGFRFTVMEKSAAQILRVKVEKLPDTILPEDVDV